MYRTTNQPVKTGSNCLTSDLVETPFVNLESRGIILLQGKIAVRIITGMDRNAPEWASITGMDIRINLFYAFLFTLIDPEISVSNGIASFEVHMSTPSNCYMVDVYPFKLCQFILKIRILLIIGPRNKSDKMAAVYIIVPMPKCSHDCPWSLQMVKHVSIYKSHCSKVYMYLS